MTKALIDKCKMRSSFDAAAAGYNEHADFQRLVGGQLFDRLLGISGNFNCVLDLGAGTGVFSERLLQVSEHLLSLDISLGMLNQARERAWLADFICGDVDSLPLRNGCFDLVFSNLVLQWCLDVRLWAAEIRRILKPGGRILLSTLGPNTLHELRSAWGAIDAYPHVNQFLSSGTLLGDLDAAGMVNIKLEVVEHKQQYSDVMQLMRSLKGIGANNALANRNKGLFGRKSLERLMQNYPGLSMNAHGVVATYEVYYISAEV